MARPRKNNAEYFSHDANLRNNIKIKALRSNFGSDGYATYCILLEILTDADNFRLQNSELQRTLIAGDIGIAQKTFDEILELVQTTDEWIWIDHLLERMEPVLRKRHAMQEAYEHRIAGEKPPVAPSQEYTPPPPPKPTKGKKERKYLGEKEWETFAKRYPKKEHMHKAKEKFLKLVFDLWPEILKGLEKWETSDKWVRGFKHNATTWINGRLWGDTPDPYTGDNQSKNARQPTKPANSARQASGYSDAKV